MIPKIIHQIWVGPYKIPRREYHFVQEVRAKHPNYEHILWNDSNRPELPPVLEEIYTLFRSRKHYTFQADLLRAYLVYEYGGVYLDADFECREGFHTLDLENHNAFFGNHYGNVETFTNGVFGAQQKHPIFQHIIGTMIAEYPQKYWYGPSFYANILKSYFNCTEEVISHEEFAKRYFDPNKILYVNFDEFHVKHFWHHALYSWSPDAERKFESGDYDHM